MLRFYEDNGLRFSGLCNQTYFMNEHTKSKLYHVLLISRLQKVAYLAE